MAEPAELSRKQVRLLLSNGPPDNRQERKESQAMSRTTLFVLIAATSAAFLAALGAVGLGRWK
jgi:hypothetical protein